MLAKIFVSAAGLMWLVVLTYVFAEYRLLHAMRFIELRNFRVKWEWRADIAVLLAWLLGSLALICVVLES